MSALSLDLVSPERVLFSGAVTSVMIPAAEGDMTIFANHAPVMSDLRAGVVVVQEEKGEKKRLFVRGGFADVTATTLTILAEQAMPVEEINPEKLGAEMRDLDEVLRDPRSEEGKAKAVKRLAEIKDMMAAVSH